MGQLYLIRHGKTALNAPGAGMGGDRIRGWVNVPLDETGRAQAKALATMFESKGLDSLYSSDLSRAADCANAIGAKAGIVNSPEIAFRPWNLGDFQGQESADIAPVLADYVLERPNEPVPNGESFLDFKMRYLPAFEKLLEEAKSGKTVALVTHYRCVKLAEAWLANGQKDELTIEPQEFLKHDLSPADVLCVYWDDPAQKWQWEPEDDAPTAADDASGGTLPTAGGDTDSKIPVSANYRQATDLAKACATCSYFRGNANVCALYDAPVEPEKVCDQWEVAKGGPMAGEKKPAALICELPALADDETRQRIQVFPGASETEYAHPKAKFKLTWDKLEEFAADIDSRDSVPVDRDHAFYKGHEAPAAGWFIPGSAAVTPEGLFADVEWTPKAAEQIRSREYRFVSPEFSFATRRNDGRVFREPTLMAASLTNRPFFTEMQPIAAEDADEELAAAVDAGLILVCDIDGISLERSDELIAAAASKQPYGNVKYADPGYQSDGKSRYPLDTDDHVRAAWSYINKAKNASRYSAQQLSRIKSRIKAAMKKIGATVGADATKGGTTMELTAEVAELLGIAADASEEDVLEAAQRVASENAALKEAQSKTNDQIQTLIADAQKGVAAANELAVMKRDGAIKDAIERGAILPAEKETYEGFWAIDGEGTEKLLAEKAVVVPLRPTGTPDARVFDAEGKALEVGDDGQPVTADLTPITVDGSEIPIDEDSAKIAAAAEAHLRKQGKTEWTADEYVAACEAVLPTLGISR